MYNRTELDQGVTGEAPLPPKLVMRLYVAGRAPNSARALANLTTIRQAYGAERFDIEIVDVLVDPLRALRDQVLVTPTLVKLSPLPLVQIAGDLSREYEVLHALGLKPLSPDGLAPG